MLSQIGIQTPIIGMANLNTTGRIAHIPYLELAVPGLVIDGLQLYLRPIEYSGSGTSWEDSSINAYNTTLVGSPLYSSTYFTYDGSVQYVNIGQSLASEDFSVGMWFRTSSIGIKMLISKETTAGNPWNYRIWLSGGQIYCDMSQVATQANLTSPLTIYNNGSWHFVMFTRNDSNWYLYVNGNQVNTRVDPYTGTVVNSQEVWIGRSAYQQGGASPSGSYQYIGDLGETLVYNRVLNDSEVLTNYNAMRSLYGIV